MDATQSLSALSPTTSASFLSNLKASALNTTSRYLREPSAKDLAYLPLRIATQIDRVIFREVPRYLFRASGIQAGTRRAHNAINAYLNIGGTPAAQAIADTAGQAMAAQAAEDLVGNNWTRAFNDVFQPSNLRAYWGILSYLTSRWSFTCFTMALILNRVTIYGSSRQRVFLNWDKRLALRIVPILLFVSQIYRLLQAIRCQSSPDYALLRYGSPNKYSLVDWSSEGGFLHWLTSRVLFSSTDADSCAAVGMSRTSPKARARYGSFSLLWPTYLRICLSHFVETMSCSIQQVPVMTEVGMSVFEHSLAFAEAESMVSHTLGLGFLGATKSSNSSTGAENLNSPTIPSSATALAISDATTQLAGSHILDRVNVPAEVLLIALLTCCNALSSHVIAVFNKQRSLRLINTGFWGLCFMASFVWGFCNASPLVRSGEYADDTRLVSGLLHFPTVAIVGFLPHMTILVGISICASIYFIALTLVAFSLKTNPSLPQANSLSERFNIAHENLQAAIQVRGINIKWHEDFYTALLRIGFNALTAASEAVFLNEGRAVEMRQFTWLEEERLDEIASANSVRPHRSDPSQFQISEEFGLPPAVPGGQEGGRDWESGYAKERKLEKEKESGKNDETVIVYPLPQPGGVGALQRSARFYLLFIYIRGVASLVGGYIAFGLTSLLDGIGITRRPTWLRRIVGKSLKKAAAERNRLDGNGTLDLWALMGEIGPAFPRNEDLDVEVEMRRRLVREGAGDRMNEVLDERMYGWWKMGGWFGTRDESGEYIPPMQDDFEDTTSVISLSTATTTDEEQSWESGSEGRKTPTQRSVLASNHTSRESTPGPGTFSDTPLDSATLARLLNPPDRASREEARLLSSHLAPKNGIMTRSRYQREVESERSRILLAGRVPGTSEMSLPHLALPARPDAHVKRPLTPTEEAEILESLILSRRRHAHPLNPGASSSAPDADPSSSPESLILPCVVCQASSRTIIAWPCRCLCVCEDCRVNLALNNFGSCVTCRRSVTGFVRLWVP